METPLQWYMPGKCQKWFLGKGWGRNKNEMNMNNFLNFVFDDLIMELRN